MSNGQKRQSPGVFTRAYWHNVGTMIKRCFTTYGRKYLYLQLVCRGGSADYIARGVSVGLFVGFLVPFGGQMPVALVLAFIFKAEKILSLAFTFVTNHVTIFFIYPLQCYIGGRLLGRHVPLGEISRNFESIFSRQADVTGVTALRELGGELAASFFVGGFCFAVISAVPGYFITRFLVESYRKRRERKLLKRRELFKMISTENVK